MRMRTILAMVVASVAVCGLLFASNVGFREKVSDFGTGDDDDGQDPPINNDDDPDTGDDDEDDDGTGDDDDSDDDDDPVTPPNGDDPPDPPPGSILPVAYGYFSDFGVMPIIAMYQIIGLDYDYNVRLDKYPIKYTAEVYAYEGTADPVYEWVQYNPALVWDKPSITVNWWLTLSVKSLFASSQYLYPQIGPDGETYYSEYFRAKWNSSVCTIGFDFGATNFLTAEHEWDSTGRIYYWEEGKYRASLTSWFEIIDNETGAVTFDHCAGGDVDFEVNV